MKNKKYLVSLFVLVALLCLGIGYAAVSKDLNINGLATTYGEGIDPTDPSNPTEPEGEEEKDFEKNFLVHFKDEAYTGKSANAENATCTAVVAPGLLTASIRASQLIIRNSSVTVSLIIVNESADLYANIGIPTIVNDNQEYYTITTNWEPTVLAPGEEKLVTVKIEVIKSAIEHQVSEFTITFTATAQLTA